MRTTRLYILSGLFSFATVYAFVWTLSEPFPIHSSNEMMRFKLIIVISLAFTVFGLFSRGFMHYIFFRFIRPIFIKVFQKLSTQQSDDPLIDGWINFYSKVESRPTIVEDSLFGKVCTFHETITKDSFIMFSVAAQENGEKLDYFIKPQDTSSPVIYVRISVRHLELQVDHQKWLAFVIAKTHNVESKEESDETEVIFIKSKAVFIGWLFFSEDIKSRFSKIKRWTDVYAFNRIVGEKVRGKFDLASILIYK